MNQHFNIYAGKNGNPLMPASHVVCIVFSFYFVVRSAMDLYYHFVKDNQQKVWGVIHQILYF